MLKYKTKVKMGHEIIILPEYYLGGWIWPWFSRISIVYIFDDFFFSNSKKCNIIRVQNTNTLKVWFGFLQDRLRSCPVLKHHGMKSRLDYFVRKEKYVPEKGWSHICGMRFSTSLYLVVQLWCKLTYVTSVFYLNLFFSLLFSLQWTQQQVG